MIVAPDSSRRLSEEVGGWSPLAARRYRATGYELPARAAEEERSPVRMKAP